MSNCLDLHLVGYPNDAQQFLLGDTIDHVLKSERPHRRHCKVVVVIANTQATERPRMGVHQIACLSVQVHQCTSAHRLCTLALTGANPHIRVHVTIMQIQFSDFPQTQSGLSKVDSTGYAAFSGLPSSSKTKVLISNFCDATKAGQRQRRQRRLQRLRPQMKSYGGISGQYKPGKSFTFVLLPLERRVRGRTVALCKFRCNQNCPLTIKSASVQTNYVRARTAEFLAVPTGDNSCKSGWQSKVHAVSGRTGSQAFRVNPSPMQLSWTEATRTWRPRHRPSILQLHY